MQTQQAKTITYQQYSSWELDQALNEGYRVEASSISWQQTGVATEHYPAPPPTSLTSRTQIKDVEQC